MDRCELEWIAGELGIIGSELKALAERGSHAADQLTNACACLAQRLLTWSELRMV
jgi:hypothetical protein